MMQSQIFMVLIIIMVMKMGVILKFFFNLPLTQSKNTFMLNLNQLQKLLICHHWDCLQVLYIQYTYTFFQIIHQNLLKPENNALSVRDIDTQLISVSRSNIMNVLILAPTSIV